jgi:hypothetical protein
MIAARKVEYQPHENAADHDFRSPRLGFWFLTHVLEHSHQTAEVQYG